jgi:signal transduction histidine kinase
MSYPFVHEMSFKSKVARQIFSMFVLCSLLPLLAISAVSFYFVCDQLKNQAYDRLRQQCKSQGLQIYDHLTKLDSELAIAANEYRRAGSKVLVGRPYDANNREGSGLKRIFLLKSDGTLEPIMNRCEDLRLKALKTELDRDRNRMLISWSGEDSRFPQLFMKRLLDQAHPEKGLLVGEINPLYLFGIGTEGALPPEVNMEVRQVDGVVLISSLIGAQLNIDLATTADQRALSGKLKSSYSEAYICSYWSLFLRHRFGSPDWIIIYRQSRASILSPVFGFTYIFILLILLTFSVIVLFSTRVIRKRTVPIETLKQGAMRIANGEFGHRVAISSGDEFEELSFTFNEMSEKLKQGRDMLMQAAKMSTFGQMGAGIVHEIGQPLHAISGYAELMRMGVSPDKHQRYLETICSETQRLTKIVSKFRVFSRLSREEPKQLCIDDILENTHDLLDHSLKMKRVQLELTKNDDLPSISGDKDALQQVFLNLIVNAIDALEEKPEGARLIRIKSCADKEMVHIEISDNGCGIPPENQRLVFDPFFTTKGEDKGTGLGLAIISSIIHKHEGEISLASVVDEGTRFTISLPISH